MKRLYLVGGTMGVGKTSASQALKRRLNRAVFLDGDWCWDAHPFLVTDETKAIVTDNICHLLNNFIRCTAYENIIFCWVMHEQPIIDSILSKLDMSGCDVKAISLVCSGEELARRLQKDIDAGLRDRDALERSLRRLPLYGQLKTIQIDVSGLTPEETAEVISGL